ncbi:hypothetical protein ACFWHL_16445 [Streptomyces massasporeus]
MSTLDLPPTPVDADPVILPGLLSGLGLTRRTDPDYQASIDGSFTESYEQYCERISNQPGDVRTEIRRLQARELELEARIAAATAANQRLQEGQ